MPNNRTLLLAISATCFALVGIALYFQHAKDMYPCALCILQRFAFLFAGSFALAAALVSKPKPWIALAALSAIAGLGVVGKHLYGIYNPAFGCGIDPVQNFVNSLPTAQLLPSLFYADGLCSDKFDPILGLSIPVWSALWFLIFTSALVVALVRRPK